MLEIGIAVAAGIATGFVVALRYFAPKTKTTRDDAVLAFLEKYVVPFLPPDKAAAAKKAALKLPLEKAS